MDELKALDNRIKNLTIGLAGMADGDTMKVSKSFLSDIRDYMTELLEFRRTQPEQEGQK